MKVLVAGATGQTGRILTDKLVAVGRDVIGAVRSDEQWTSVERAGAQPVHLDLTEEKSVAKAVQGQDAVIFAAGSGGKAVEAVDRDGAIALVDAAKAAGVRRFVMLSSIYAGRPEKGPESLSDYLAAKHEADEHLKQSGLDFTIVRPGMLHDGAEVGMVTLAEAFDREDAKISRADVAATLAAALTAAPTVGRAFEIIEGDIPIDEALSRPPE